MVLVFGTTGTPSYRGLPGCPGIHIQTIGVAFHSGVYEVGASLQLPAVSTPGPKPRWDRRGPFQRGPQEVEKP